MLLLIDVCTSIFIGGMLSSSNVAVLSPRGMLYLLSATISITNDDVPEPRASVFRVVPFLTAASVLCATGASIFHAVHFVFITVMLYTSGVVVSYYTVNKSLLSDVVSIFIIAVHYFNSAHALLLTDMHVSVAVLLSATVLTDMLLFITVLTDVFLFIRVLAEVRSVNVAPVGSRFSILVDTTIAATTWQRKVIFSACSVRRGWCPCSHETHSSMPSLAAHLPLN